MTCLFCRDDATLSRSPLDEPAKIPDMHQVNCPACQLEYHVSEPPRGWPTHLISLDSKTGVARVAYCNKNRIRYAIVYGTKTRDQRAPIFSLVVISFGSYAAEGTASPASTIFARREGRL